MSEQIKLRRTQGKERERGLLQDTTNGQQIETNHNYGGDGKNVEEQLAPSPPLLAPKPVLPLTAALMNGMSAMSLSPPLTLTTSPPPPILLPASQMMSSFSSMPASFSEFSAISSVFAPQPIQSMPTSPWTDQEMYSYLVQSKLTPQLTQTVPQFYPTPFINPDLGSLMSLLSYTNLCFPSHN